MARIKPIKATAKVSRYEHIHNLEDLDRYAELIKHRLTNRIAEEIEKNIIVDVSLDEETGDVIYTTEILIDYGKGADNGRV